MLWDLSQHASLSCNIWKVSEMACVQCALCKYAYVPAMQRDAMRCNCACVWRIRGTFYLNLPSVQIPGQAPSLIRVSTQSIIRTYILKLQRPTILKHLLLARGEGKRRRDSTLWPAPILYSQYKPPPPLSTSGNQFSVATRTMAGRLCSQPVQVTPPAVRGARASS